MSKYKHGNDIHEHEKQQNERRMKSVQRQIFFLVQIVLYSHQKKLCIWALFMQWNEPHKFVLNLSQRLELGSSNKHVALQNSFITRGKI